MPQFAQDTPQYQRDVTRNVASVMKPQYEDALRSQAQRIQNMGMAGTGADIYALNRIGQDYTGAIQRVGSQSGMRASEIGEENRRRQEQAQWGLEDFLRQKHYATERSNTAYDQFREQRDHDQDAAWRKFALETVGKLVGQAVGSYFGGPLGSSIGGKAGSQTGGGVDSIATSLG